MTAEKPSPGRGRQSLLLLAALLAGAPLGLVPLASSSGESLVEASGGAAPGYVDDQVCASCHGEIFQSYQEVGMARSFFRPTRERQIEDFENGHFYHEPSRNHYEMLEEDGEYSLRRYQISPSGRQVNVKRQGIDWVLGSGNHSRTYLYQTEIGELYQLPIAWYTQTRSWGMAPGYDHPEHYDLVRPVQRECMFCHNAYPDVPAGSDVYGQPHLYPQKLPEGTGCQRCHGPGQRHVETAFGDSLGLDDPASTIVNPARLETGLRNDVCYQCHMQPSVALPGVRLFGRGDYSFRPGQKLSDTFAQMDVVEENEEGENRFEINHHPYRLEQSRCFQESAGALSCLSCHDPHRKVAPENRAAHFRAACLECHQVDSCGFEAMGADGASAASDLQDCASCHMPKHRTADVVHVVTTDHRIGLWPDLESLLAPREESDPVIVDVKLLRPEEGPQGELAEIYRATSVLRAGGGLDALEHLESMLVKRPLEEIEPWLRLARGQLLYRPPEASIATLQNVLERAPGHPLAREWLGLAHSRNQDLDRAREVLQSLVDSNPRRPEARFNLGRVLMAQGRIDDAIPELRAATELRPNLTKAWHSLGDAHRVQKRFGPALAAYQKALAIDPRHEEAYAFQAAIFAATGNLPAARNLLRHGLSVLGESDSLEALLERLEPESGP